MFHDQYGKMMGFGGWLSRERERDLTMRGRDGDAQALAELVASHLQFVHRIARKYRRYGVPMSDLIQEGVIGLLQAVRKFDPSKGHRLSTYARWWVRAAIQDHVVRSWSLVRVGTTAAQKAMFFRIRRMMYELKDGADALTEDVLAPVAKRFGVPLKEAVAVARRAAGLDQSLNQRIQADEPDEWLDKVADPAPTPEEEASEESEDRYRKGLIARALEALPQRERTIILKRYLAEIKNTREALGRELGISKERVRQLELKALGKLKNLLAPLKGKA